MNPYEYLTERQYAWARRHGITIDEAGYTEHLNDNLFLPLTTEAIQEFQAGAGRELENSMRAVHSSSALVANVFNYWRLYNDLIPITSAICLDYGNCSIRDIRFEVQSPINWPPPPQAPVMPPHLDVVIRLQDRSQPDVPKAIAIESKFGEIYNQDQGSFADRYLATENATIWAGMEPLQELADQIHRGEILFQRLKVAQLIKHILGLAAVFRGTQNFSLIYLWYPVPGQEAVGHEDELRRFQQLTNACKPRIKFRAIKYQDLIHSLARAQGGTHGAYIDYLLERYF